MPFQRPPQAAAGWVPKRMARTGFISSLQLFPGVMHPIAAFRPHPPRMGQFGPGTGVRTMQPPAPEAAAAAAVTSPGPTAGYFGGFRGGPNMGSMRTQVLPNGGNMRSGATGAAALIRSMTPAGFPFANVPGGSYSIG